MGCTVEAHSNWGAGGDRKRNELRNNIVDVETATVFSTSSAGEIVRQHMTTPTEQPPRKLSGKRTAPLEQSGERRATRPPKGIFRRQRSRGRETLRYRHRWGIDAGTDTLSVDTPVMLNSIWTMSCHESPLLARCHRRHDRLCPRPPRLRGHRLRHASLRGDGTSFANAASCLASNAEVWIARPPC